MADFLGLALSDAGHDLYLDAEGNLAMAADNRAIAEHVKQRLLTYAGEWFLDTSAGVPWVRYVFTRPFNEVVAESVIKAEILATPGVVALEEFELQVDPRGRELRVLRAVATSTLDEPLEVAL